MKTFYTIYKTTNKLNGKIYIGSHKTQQLDDGYLGSGTYLKRAISKHGPEAFEKEILFIFETAEEMYAKEAELVNGDYLEIENTYNMKVGGFGGFDYLNSSGKNIYSGHADQARINLENAHPALAVARKSQQFKERESAHLKQMQRKSHEKYPKSAFYGKTHSEYTKGLISKKNKIAQIGQKNSQFNSCWITNGIENKKMSKSAELPSGWRLGRSAKMHAGASSQTIASPDTDVS